MLFLIASVDIYWRKKKSGNEQPFPREGKKKDAYPPDASFGLKKKKRKRKKKKPRHSIFPLTKGKERKARQLATKGSRKGTSVPAFLTVHFPRQTEKKREKRKKRGREELMPRPSASKKKKTTAPPKKNTGA